MPGLRVLLSVAAVATLGIAGADAGESTPVQFQRCEGLVKGALWSGVFGTSSRFGNRYAVWVGSSGPSCVFARSNTARLSRLGTPQALRRASFGGLKCRVSPLFEVSEKLMSLRPRTAVGGCWTVAHATTGRYFLWEPRR
jgi:hypothetical protein